MDIQLLTTLPFLVEDIAMLVLKLAAERRSDHGLAWATVSKQVKLWVEPVLYRDIVVDPKGLFHRTVTAPNSTKPPSFFTAHVKSLLFRLNTIQELSQVPDILEKCSSVRSLSIWAGSDEDTSLDLQAILLSDRLAPTHLSVGAYLFGEGNATFNHPIFRNVTHLDLPCYSEKDWEWDSLNTLDKMTHLNIEILFPVNRLTPTITPILQSKCPRLRVIVVSPSFCFCLVEDEVVAMNRGEIDPRLVVTSSDEYYAGFDMSREETRGQWGHPSTAVVTLWSRAEDSIRERSKRRKRGRI